MGIIKKIINNLPEVAPPTQRRLSFKEKLKWTSLVLVIYFILGLMPLFGLGQNELQRFEFLSIILAAQFGSIISLGIGPIVTASIVLQLINGSGLYKFDLATSEGKKNFQGIQKLLAIFFIIFEAAIYVFMGGLAPSETLQGSGFFFQMQLLLVFQLFIGGMLILLLDEVVSKWGFGSGISLFIAAGVSTEIFVQAFNWLPGPGGLSGVTYAVGAIPALIQALAAGDPTTAGIKIATILSTVVIFAAAVYAQAMKIEIPLSFGRIRGHGIRWPLAFIYTSNIPVILVAALMANFQLWGRLMQNLIGPNLFARFSESTGQLTGGLIFWIQSPNLVNNVVTGSFTGSQITQAVVYILFMVAGSIVFSIFWVQTAGMDARSQARHIMDSGLQIPGFRRDERVLEHLLQRYIWPLTIMGATAVGLLAALADVSGALSRGTGILLAVMIIYRLYEDIAQQHMLDMFPAMRKFMGG